LVGIHRRHIGGPHRPITFDHIFKEPEMIHAVMMSLQIPEAAILQFGGYHDPKSSFEII
jgi:hypothetical protein